MKRSTVNAMMVCVAVALVLALGWPALADETEGTGSGDWYGNYRSAKMELLLFPGEEAIEGLVRLGIGRETRFTAKPDGEKLSAVVQIREKPKSSRTVPV